MVLAFLLNLPISLIVVTQNQKLKLSRVQFRKQIGIGLVIGFFVFAQVMMLVTHPV